MVLERYWLAALLVVGLAACMKTTPVQRLATPTMIAVAFVNDKGGEQIQVPSAFVSEVRSELQERNLVMKKLVLDPVRSVLARKRDSRDRLQTISGLAGEAPLLLLVETRAEYYSQLNGRYRWTVYAKLSLAKAGSLDRATVTSFTVPVTLSFDHQREEEALAYAAGALARKLGQELDDFLAGLDMATAPASAAAVPKRSVSPLPLEPIYFVMLDRFHNGDTSNDAATAPADPQAFHGGDIAGLIEKLDYIRDLGFGTIWLSPIFSMRTEKIGEHGAFHGYWTEDLRKVEARFGTEEDLQRLRQELEARDMKLVMDMVLNHVGYDTRFVTEHPSWFHNKGTIKDWEDPVEVTTHDVHGLPDLDQDNREVYEYLLAASAHWVETLRPAGFRLDAVKHVKNEFWQSYTRDLRRQTPGPFATIGELYNGSPAAIAAGFEEGGFTHLFDFPLYFAMSNVFCKGQSAAELAAILSLDRLYPSDSQLITFADNHDLPRLWSSCGQDQTRVEALLTFLLTARGIPCLNYGTEAALSGDSEPSNRKDMVFTEKGPLRDVISSILRLRAQHPVLQEGRDRALHVDDEHYAYLRIGREETALIAVNLGTRAWRVPLPAASEGSAVDALRGHSITEALTVDAGAVGVALYTEKTGSALAESGRKRSVVVLAEASGDDLRLVGGGPELGSWNPEMAPRGVRQADSRFRFELSLPENTTSAYKLVRSVDGQQHWEKRENRYLVLTERHDGPIEIRFAAGE